jgi:aspartate/methionine/tyrosine aminotransferase
MQLSPFLLDQWLAQKDVPDSPIKFDLGSSTGPTWNLRELLTLSGEDEYERMLETKLFYTPSDGSLKLRQAIARLEGVNPEDVQVVAGASEALTILFFLAADTRANIVLPNPGFPAYSPLAEAFGLETRKYELGRENGFQIDLDDIRALVDSNTRLVLLNLPHNPTGAVVSDAEMEALYDFCVDRGVQFVCDQVYHPIYHGAETRSAARLPHSTVLGDFSKALCLSGLRIGWIVDRDARRQKSYLNARSYFTVSSTPLGEHLAAVALEHREGIYGRARRVTQKNLSVLEQFMCEQEELFDWVRPRGGMTAFPWLKDGADSRELCQRLARSGVLVAPGDCFGAPSHIRIGFGTSGEQFPAAVERLAELLRSEALV